MSTDPESESGAFFYSAPEVSAIHLWLQNSNARESSSFIMSRLCFSLSLAAHLHSCLLSRCSFHFIKVLYWVSEFPSWCLQVFLCCSKSETCDIYEDNNEAGASASHRLCIKAFMVQPAEEASGQTQQRGEREKRMTKWSLGYCRDWNTLR